MSADPTTPWIPTHSSAKSVLVLSCHQPTPGSSHMYYPGLGPPPSRLDMSQRCHSHMLAWHNNLRPKNHAVWLEQSPAPCPEQTQLEKTGQNVISWKRTKGERMHVCSFILKYNAKIHFHTNHCNVLHSCMWLFMKNHEWTTEKQYIYH